MLPSALRSEVHEFNRACERLLFTFNTSSAFTADELEIINYYVVQVGMKAGESARGTITRDTTVPAETASHNGNRAA